jgi:hypothetical protein
MAKKIFNSDVEILGALNMSTVPNSIGEVLTFDALNQVSKRTYAEILTDIGAVAKAGDTMTGDLIVPDEAYGIPWNANLEVPTKNAIYDEMELKLDSSSYTAADVLSKLLTVDGSGSGLDADKLDGLNSLDFARAGARTDNYVWVRRTSTPFYVTNQGTGDIAAFRAGAGDGSSY